MGVTADELWDALREQCCATKPSTKATTIVQLRKADVKAALATVAEKHAREHEEFVAWLEEQGRKPASPALKALMRSVPPWAIGK